MLLWGWKVAFFSPFACYCVLKEPLAEVLSCHSSARLQRRNSVNDKCTGLGGRNLISILQTRAAVRRRCGISSSLSLFDNMCVLACGCGALVLASGVLLVSFVVVQSWWGWYGVSRVNLLVSSLLIFRGERMFLFLLLTLCGVVFEFDYIW